MRRQHILLVAGFLILPWFLDGCATESRDRIGTAEPGFSMSPGDRAFHYRRQAAELREMAKRLEMEAEWFAQKGGADSELARRNREMAQGFWATAEQADQRAREFQSQLPHGQLY
jgi:hypothetical protein